jgi:transcriptional regulator with XRE-family HTH domain
MNGIGARVRRYRLQRDMSIPCLARAVGLSPRYVEMIEAGTRTPAVSVLYRLGEALEVPAGAFLEDQTELPDTLVRAS